MTDKTEQGRGERCGNCKHFDGLEVLGVDDAYIDRSIGACYCEESDHHGHVIADWHWCEQYEATDLWSRSLRRGAP